MTGATVVKVGGSLLAWPELPARLARFLDGRRPPLVLLAGGGLAADAIRTLDRAHRLGPRRAHALALRALDLTTHALRALTPGAVVARRLDDLPAAWSSGSVPILAPRLVLDADDTSPDALAHSWDVTSDSIAARVAVLLRAPELVLLKSAPCPPGLDRAAASRLGLIDPAFPAASRPIPHVLLVNLRDPAMPAFPLP